MKEYIPVTNRTLELADCRDSWFFDEKHQCWCLEDILYTDKATTPKFQRMSIFVPKPYMSAPGVVDHAGGMNGYTAATVPVIFENNSAGYMQMPHTWLEGPRCYAHQYLAHGFVYVTCGNRGSESKDADGKWCGKSPANLVDLKTAIRFLRHNKKELPGDFGKIISAGWSAGGAMSTLLAVTGDNALYEPYLRENGAFMDESDAVYASQIYCPIIDLDHADLAYEWMFRADKENENSPAGPAGVMTPFGEALSGKLCERYIRYFNQLGLGVSLGEDGRSGSAYEHLMSILNDSATVFLKKLEAGELPLSCSTADYIAGNYEYEAPAPMDEEAGDEADLMQGHAGPGVALRKDSSETAEPPTLGDMMSRPPGGAEVKSVEPPMVTLKGKDKSAWLSWDGREAKVSDLDTYVLNHRRRMKPCTSFDTLGNDSGENRVFGTPEQHYMHFNEEIADAIAELKVQFPEEYEKYYPAYARIYGDEELKKRKYLYNPFNYIGTKEQSTQAEYYRIRVGASDADTSFSVSMSLALALQAAGKQTDYALVWDQPHSEADYPGEVLAWIDRICK